MRVNKHLIVLSLLFMGLGILLLGCKREEKKGKPRDADSPFEMYELSPMAMLMEQMYVDNMRIKAKIQEGATDFGEFPVFHETIFSARLTDPSDKDDFFEWQARYFIEVEKAFYKSEETEKKSQFNAIVNSCLECHKRKCGGPIPRIKKLFIP